MGSQPQWYAVHTYAGHENKVMTNILRQAEARNLRSKVFDIRIPTETEVRTRGGKTTEYKRKVFPGYILINMILDEDTWYLVKSTTGVTGFVSSGNKPVPLQEKEVQAILQTEKTSEQRPRVQWKRGDLVRITEGPFTDFTGAVEEVQPEKQRLRVLISIFGRETPLEVEFSQVEKA